MSHVFNGPSASRLVANGEPFRFDFAANMLPNAAKCCQKSAHFVALLYMKLQQWKDSRKARRAFIHADIVGFQELNWLGPGARKSPWKTVRCGPAGLAIRARLPA